MIWPIKLKQHQSFFWLDVNQMPCYTMVQTQKLAEGCYYKNAILSGIRFTMCYGWSASPEDLAHRITSYEYSKQIGPDYRIFPINWKRAWQIAKLAGERVNLQKRIWPHLLRHSDAIERLRQTGNPKALQIHLGHSSPLMTTRYLATLTAEDALRIQQQVEFGRQEWRNEQ